MEQLDLLLNAPVHFRDNKAAKLAYVVTDADGRHATELIVERGLPLISKEARVVPISLVDSISEDAVWVSIRSDQLADYPEYQETTIEKPDPTASAGGAVSASGSGYAGTPSSPPTIRERLRQGVNAGHIVLGRQTEVRTLHQSVGHVDRLQLNPENKAITQVVMRRGLLRTEHPIIPVEMIESVSEDHLLLAMSSDEVDELPRYLA